MSTERRGAQRGFVLAVTLWILAAITLAVALLTLWSYEEVREASDARDRTADAIAMASTRDALLYLGATREVTLAGLPTRALTEAERASLRLQEFGALRTDPRGGELRLDGTVYRGRGAARFALQDEAGLLGLLLPTSALVDRYLESAGVRREQIGRLRDALLDYIDEDRLKRLNGAEQREYEQAGREPPPNRRPLIPGEVLRALGWSELPAQVRARLPEEATVFYSGAVNLNTAPESLLATWLPGCPQTCRTVVARRRTQPFASGLEVQTVAGVRLPGDPLIDYRVLPSDTLRMTLWGRTGAGWRIHVRFTPLADKRAPWSILAAYPVPRPSSDAPAQDPGSDLLADAAPDRP